MARNYSNIALDTTLVAGILAGDLTCVVASAAGWPAAPFAAVLDPGSLTIEEVVQVTLVVGTTFTITRGFDGTTAAAHSLGATVRHSAIAGDFTDLQAALLNVAYTNVANTFTLGPNRFNAGADGNVALAARRHSSIATANIFEAQDETGAALVYGTAAGDLVVKGGKVAVGSNPTFTPTNPAFPTSTYTTLFTASNEASITTIPGGALGIYANVYSSAKFAPTTAHSVTIQGMASNVELAATGAGSYGQVNAIFASVVKNDAIAGSAINAISGGTYNQGGATVPLLASIYGYLTQNSATPSIVTDARILQAEANVGNLNTVTTLQGVYSRLTAASGAIVGTFSAFRGRMNSINAGAVITNAYGLWIDKMVGGSTIQRAIQTDGGTVQHQTGTASVIGLIVNGFTSQSANLQEWQDVSANVLGSVSSIGAALFRPRDAVTAAVTPALTLGHESTGTPAASFGSRLLFQLESTTTSDRDASAIDTIWTTATDATRTSAIVLYTVNSAAALAETLRIAPVQVTVTGHVSSNTTNTHNLGSSGARWKDIWASGAFVARTAVLAGAVATDIPMIARGFAAQTGNLQEWQSSASAVLSSVSENGYFMTRKIAAPADAELAASELAFWFDSTNGAGKLMIKAKTIDGTVVTGNVVLA